MPSGKLFHLRYLRQEQHLMLPKSSSIRLIQELYDILFQYLIDLEKEKSLHEFICMVEEQIRSRSNAPFSMPISELEFLGEGVQELKLLNWTEIPVGCFEIIIDENNIGDVEGELDIITAQLERFMIVGRRLFTNVVYIYPRDLIRF